MSFMKKGLLIALLAATFFLTGCEKKENSPKTKTNSGTLSCNKIDTDDDGKKIDDTMNITYKNNKVTKVENINISEMDKDMLEMSYSFGVIFANLFNEIEGMDVKYTKESDTNLKYVMTVDYTKLNIDSLKESLGENFDDDSFYSSTNISLDEFKENNLKDYSCK